MSNRGDKIVSATTVTIRGCDRPETVDDVAEFLLQVGCDGYRLVEGGDHFYFTGSGSKGDSWRWLQAEIYVANVQDLTFNGWYTELLMLSGKGA